MQTSNYYCNTFYWKILKKFSLRVPCSVAIFLISLFHLIASFAARALGVGKDGQGVFLKDIWPLRKEIQEVESRFVIPAMFEEAYSKLAGNKGGSAAWQALNAPSDALYPWDLKSTYVRKPPFFKGMTMVRDPWKRNSYAK
jgi:aconitase A